MGVSQDWGYTAFFTISSIFMRRSLSSVVCGRTLLATFAYLNKEVAIIDQKIDGIKAKIGQGIARF